MPEVKRASLATQLIEELDEGGGMPGHSVFAQFVEQLADVVLAVRPNGDIVFANRALRTILDLGPHEVSRLNLFDLVPTDHLTGIRDVWNRVLALPPGSTLSEDILFGGRGWVHMSAQTWPGPDGEVALITSVGRDQTAERLAQEQLETLNQRLEESNRDLHDFAHVASHDLHEPLRKITGFIDRLLKDHDGQFDGQAAAHLGRVRSATRRMQQLIDDLLAYARVDTEVAAFEVTDLDAVLADVLADLEVAVLEANAQVTADPLPAVPADPSQMRQLFQNLVGNSIKFRSADVAPVVAIRVGRHGAVWRIAVTDNGIGFDQADASRIFGPFERLHGRNRYEGSGVGLAVCRRIVERHHGTIEATSSPGAGTTVVVTLPAVVS